jgi:hypothetical protein
MAIEKGLEVWRGQVRLPEPLAKWVKQRAKNNFQSMNAQVVELLRSAKEEIEAKNAAH